MTTTPATGSLVDMRVARLDGTTGTIKSVMYYGDDDTYVNVEWDTRKGCTTTHAMSDLKESE